MPEKTEREQLELAAKAAGYEVLQYSEYSGLQIGSEWWDPRENNEDSFMLAVDLKLIVRCYDGSIIVDGCYITVEEHDVSDRYQATRKAIFRAAVKIGENM